MAQFERFSNGVGIIGLWEGSCRIVMFKRPIHKRSTVQHGVFLLVMAASWYGVSLLVGLYQPFTVAGVTEVIRLLSLGVAVLGGFCLVVGIMPHTHTS